MLFLEGFVIGLATVIFVGPVFFLLLNSSLQYGSKSGLAVAFGIIVSDILCVALCYYGLSKVLTTDIYQNKLAFAGSGILFLLGVSYLFKKPKLFSESVISSKKVTGFFLKGFSVNFFNPFVFVVWIGIFEYGKQKTATEISLHLFLTAVLLGILTTDLIKVFLAKKLKRFITRPRLNIFFKITGIILLLFSLRLLVYVFKN